MKKVTLIIVAIFLTCSSLISQSDTISYSKEESFQKDEIQTLFNTKKGFGFYTDFNSRVSSVADDEALLMGGGVGFVFGHVLNFGLEGYGLVNSVRTQLENPSLNSTYLGLGYGGLHIEPVLFSKKLIHVSFPVLLGVGGVVHYEKKQNDFDIVSSTADFIMVAEPGALLEINLLKWMRLGFGANYRFVEGVDVSGLQSSDLENWSATASLRLGIF